MRRSTQCMNQNEIAFVKQTPKRRHFVLVKINSGKNCRKSKSSDLIMHLIKPNEVDYKLLLFIFLLNVALLVVCNNKQPNKFVLIKSLCRILHFIKYVFRH